MYKGQMGAEFRWFGRQVNNRRLVRQVAMPTSQGGTGAGK